MRSLHMVRMTEAMLPQVQALDETCLGGLWSLDAYRKEIAAPNSCLLALLGNGEVVLGYGCLWSILDEGHITILAVHPDVQGNGLGSYLLWGLLDAARRWGLAWATLEVRESNAPAIALYERFGFTLVGRRPRYYATTGEDALIYWRQGLQTPEVGERLVRERERIGDRLRSTGWQLAIAEAPDSVEIASNRR